MATVEEYEERVQELKMQRLIKFNDDVERELLTERLSASTVCKAIVKRVEDTPDYLVNEKWKLPEHQNMYLQYRLLRKSNLKRGCCTIS